MWSSIAFLGNDDLLQGLLMASTKVGYDGFHV